MSQQPNETTNDSNKPFLKNLQDSTLGALNRMDAGRSVATTGLLAATVAGIVAGTMWMSSSNYVPLYSNQESFDTASIIQTLESENIRYEVQLADGTIWVPKSKLASARMKMAAQGIKAELPSGMETLDQYSGISTSQFMESNRYNYAVEGELARTIMTIDGVTRARVHLAIPERTLFVGREEQKPTASVALDISRPLEPAQVEAIINLVAGSVTGMTPESVSVVDQRGNLLSDNLMTKTPARVSVQQMDYVRKLETRIAERAGDMLDPVLGQDNYRIRVAADIDFSQVEETQEILDDKPILTRESGIKDSSAEIMAGGVPGSLSNQAPMSDAELAEMGITEPLSNYREEYSRQFETGRSVIHRKLGESRVKQLSVSVLINDKVAPENGWTPEQIADFEQIVRLAAGLNEERGDQLKLSTVPFIEREAPVIPEPPLKETITDYMEILKLPFMGLVMILLVLFGVRPLVTYLTKKPASTTKPTSSDEGISEGEPLDNKQTGRNSELGAGTDSMAYELPSSESELSVQIDHLKMLVDKKTPRVTEIVKTWVRSDD